MKKHISIALALLFSVGIADVSAQSFLKKLEKNVKKEVENRVNKEVKKRVNKVMDKGVEKFEGNQSQKAQSQTQSASDKAQSSQDANDRHLSILEGRGEIVRTIIVENPPQNQAPVTGKVNGHEWVDLGLPSGTRWATCNVGATSPSQPGDLYAWGETATKTSYMPANSKTHGKDMDDLSGSTTYDVATAKWGKGWRMPTKEEFAELLAYCPFPQYEKQDGRWGQIFSSRANEKNIFLPATGFKENGSKHQEANGCGNYWTSTPQDGSYKNGAHDYHFGAAMGEMGQGERSSGFAVRPVIDNDALITTPSQGETNGHGWVDLGLPSGTKWATCNVGAATSENHGDFFQWAETSPTYDKTSPKNNVSGKWMSGIGGSTKYDAATALWGEGWKIPTKKDFQELMENCTFEWTSLGRIKGCKVISKINGNYIFLPAAGRILSYSVDRYPNDLNGSACYWASTPSNDKHYYKADGFSINSKYVGPTTTLERTNGCPIRPVTK